MNHRPSSGSFVTLLLVSFFLPLRRPHHLRRLLLYLLLPLFRYVIRLYCQLVFAYDLHVGFLFNSLSFSPSPSFLLSLPKYKCKKICYPARPLAFGIDNETENEAGETSRRKENHHCRMKYTGRFCSGGTAWCSPLEQCDLPLVRATSIKCGNTA